MHSASLEAFLRPGESCFDSLVREKLVFNFVIVVFNKVVRLDKS